MPGKISVLVSARKDSKYLAKFMLGFFENTLDEDNTEVLVMMNKNDTWNDELVRFYSRRGVKFFREDWGLGRYGLHTYYNELLKHATGDWIVYFCDDHFINKAGWDIYVHKVILGEELQGDSKNKPFPLDPARPWVVVPKFDNCGAMNHIVSRGFVEAMDGSIGGHGWIDTYINELIEPFNKQISIRLDNEVFHDFTHDSPSPFDEVHTQTDNSEGKKLPKVHSGEYHQTMHADRKKLQERLS